MIALTPTGVRVSAALLFGTVLTVSAAEPTGTSHQSPAQTTPAAQALRRASVAAGRSVPTRRWIRIGRGSSTSATGPRTTPPATTSSGTWTRRRPPTSATRRPASGVMDFQKVTYRSSVGDMDIPGVPLPAARRSAAPSGHAAMVWVHGGVHGNWGISMFPFVREAVERGYVVICPEYRGSTGYGEKHHNAIDYGGYEVDDVMSAVGFLKTLPHVDQERLGIMGWSHGGYITLFSVFRDETPFKAAAAMVPVTNLVFRLSYKGPGYQRSFSTQARIQGLPFEKRDLYIERSPLYHVDKLKTPLLVHVATNDTDVNFVEDQQIIDALRSRKPDLAETKVYVDPTPGPASGGHTFNRRTNAKTLERDDSPEQRDSWNRTWTFFEWHLRPYEDRSAGGSRF